MTAFVGFAKILIFFHVELFFPPKIFFFVIKGKKIVLLHQVNKHKNTSMQAFILAAGLGTRLKPLTDRIPKALVEVQGQPLLKITLDNLIRQGATRIVVNVHHFADMVSEYLLSRHWEVPILISDERDLLLDTGGGLKKAESLFAKSEPILIHNVDILSRLDISQLVKKHSDSMSLATLVVSCRDTSRYLLFDEQKLLAGWENKSTGEMKWVNNPINPYLELAFDGIGLIEPKLLELLPPADQPYSIIPSYLKIAKNHRINYFELNPKDWLDVGKPQTLSQAQQWKLF